MILYALSLTACLGLFLAVRHIGEGWFPTPELTSSVSTGDDTVSHGHPVRVDVISHVLTILMVVIGLGLGLGRLFKWFGQPAVMGEVVAGLCLGPSLLGAISPELMNALLPSASQDPHGLVMTSLQSVAQLGIVLYMLTVGLELDGKEIRHQARAAVAISHMSIVFPFVLGACLSLGLYQNLAGANATFTGFSLFMGVAMAITAFPVLARILTDRGLQTTPTGAMALTCAAADDATAWCLLAVVIGVVNSNASQGLIVILQALLFVGALLVVVRPLVSRWCQKLDQAPGPISSTTVTLGILGGLASAVITERIGIHALFGAFLFGAIIPADSGLGKAIRTRLRSFVSILLLPAFFAYTGLRTQIGLVDGMWAWITCLVIIAVAILGKFGGTYVAARYTGQSHREATALGFLMNTRGLMELIVLNIGLDLQVLSPRLFAMMVLMAITTTLMTGPILNRLMPSQPVHEDPEPPLSPA